MAVIHAGSRKDLPILSVPVAPQDAADSLIADTQFAVMYFGNEFIGVGGDDCKRSVSKGTAALNNTSANGSNIGL
jgi:hypothetical protein